MQMVKQEIFCIKLSFRFTSNARFFFQVMLLKEFVHHPFNLHCYITKSPFKAFVL
jgi:hypothetical protein